MNVFGDADGVDAKEEDPMGVVSTGEGGKTCLEKEVRRVKGLSECVRWRDFDSFDDRFGVESPSEIKRAWPTECRWWGRD